MSGFRKIFGTALCLSLAIHVGAVALTMKSKPDLEISGAGEVQNIVLGRSPFSTIAAGAVPQVETVEPFANQAVQHPVAKAEVPTTEVSVVRSVKPAATQQVSPVKPVETAVVSEVVPLARTGGNLVAATEPVAIAETASQPVPVSATSPSAPPKQEQQPESALEAVSPVPVATSPVTAVEPQKPGASETVAQPVQQQTQPEPLDQIDTAAPTPKVKPAHAKQRTVGAGQKPRPGKSANPTKKKRQTTQKASRAGVGGKSNRTAQKGGAGRKGKSKSAGNSDVTNYPAKVHRKVLRSVRPPRSIGRLHTDAHVRFTVTSNGAVTGVRLARSSGNKAFDQVALKSVRRAAPFPPIPAAAKRRTWTFTVPVGVR